MVRISDQYETMNFAEKYSLLADIFRDRKILKENLPVRT